jgi:ankyrin repeat protein
MVLKHGADPNIRDRNGRTPLYEAIIGRNETMVSSLLYCGADITIKVNDELPLITAIKYNRFWILRELLESKSYIQEYNHCNAMHHAIGTKYIVKLLLTYNFNVNEQNNDRDTPLHCAIRRWSVCNNSIYKEDIFEIIKYLLNAGADLLIENNKGITPRMMVQELNELEDLFALYEVPIKEPDCE